MTLEELGITPAEFVLTYLNRVSNVLTVEQYNAMVDWFASASDEAISGFINWGLEELEKHGSDDFSAKEYFSILKDVRKANGVTYKNQASGQFHLELLPEKENLVLRNKIKASHPSDYICLTRKEDEFLMDLWMPKTATEISIPSDLFFARTIPLMDCVITVDERGFNDGWEIKYRVVIFEDYQDAIKQSLDDETETPITVGAVFYQMGKGCDDIFFPIVVMRGGDSLIRCNVGWFSDEAREKCVAPYGFTKQFVDQLMVQLLETWYGIQIALLHPAVKSVFKFPARTTEPGASSSQKPHKRKAKYIRKHYITLDKLEEVSNSKEKRKINRKCLAWYVIGHWRTYEDGKKVFVMPYWKGALRNMKQNADSDDRERKIEWDVAW